VTGVVLVLDSPQQGKRIKTEMMVEMAALRPFRPRSADGMDGAPRSFERPAERGATNSTSRVRFDAFALFTTAFALAVGIAPT
jgi:hypothetical protein